MKKDRARRAVSGAFALALSLPFACRAQGDPGYPSKPIKVVVPAPPGSANDLLVRRIAEQLASRLGQPMIIDNRPGAGAIIGTQAVAHSAPDGYTLLSANVVHVINGSINGKLSYHPLRDFTPISLVGYTPSVLMAYPGADIASVSDLIKKAKASTGGMNYASAGIGTAGHLAGELFRRAANVPLQHVPYKGITQAITDALGGHVPLIYLFGPDAVPLARAGKLVPLAVTAPTRSSLLPDTPTFAELGFPGVELTAWYGFLGPARMPPAVTARLNTALQAILKDPGFKQQLADLMFEAQTSSPQELENLMARDLERLSQVARDAGMRSE